MPVSLPELVRNRFSRLIGGMRSDAIPGAFAEFRPRRPIRRRPRPRGETRHVILQAAPAIAGAPSRRGPAPSRRGSILIPGLPALAPNVERHPVPGGGTRTLALDAGDELTVIDREGRQRCELVVFDRTGGAPIPP